MTRILIYLLLFVSLAFVNAGKVIAVDTLSLGTAINISVNEKGIKDGDIIVTSPDGYKRSANAYDPLLFGVVSNNPALYLEDTTVQHSVTVVTSGKARVRVSTINGPIHKGDYITSSKEPGVGQKALDNGYILGATDEEYTAKDPKKIGYVLVTLNPHFMQLTNNISANIINGLRLGMSAALLTPLGALRYFISGFIALISFYLGFRFFGHASRIGVEAIGRNPLATRAILFGVVLNVTITIAIMFFGVALAYIILVL